jgi:hypothetical protein
MPDRPYHQKLHLENFTVFRDATFEFVPSVNVLIGENGTGKTHVMKVLYAVQFALQRDKLPELPEIFNIERRSDLISMPIEEGNTTSLEGVYRDEMWKLFVEHSSKLNPAYFAHDSPLVKRPVFIPATEMMGHTRRFLTTYDEYKIDFDLTHRDIVALLLSPEKRIENSENDSLLGMLDEKLGGTVEEENERFYLKTPQGRYSMPLVAEGLRKLATLRQLIQNGWLEPGATLFWDEPEVNLNPSLMDEVVAVLLELSRRGVQIFVATHSYVILKEFDLQAKPDDSLRYFALERTENGTQVHPADNYADLSPNLIAEQFDRLYDMELTRATGRKRK